MFKFVGGVGGEVHMKCGYSVMEKGNIISTREKLGALIKRFMKLMEEQKQSIFELSNLINEGARIFKDPRKAQDIIFYFEALGLILRISP
jgi:hypothetical protein